MSGFSELTNIMAETEMDLTDRLNTARMETATQNIAAENRSIHSQFVRFTLCKVIKLLLLGHCLLIAYGAFSEQLTLLHDLMQTAIITLFYNFVTATFARHTSVSTLVNTSSKYYIFFISNRLTSLWIMNL